MKSVAGKPSCIFPRDPRTKMGNQPRAVERVAPGFISHREDRSRIRRCNMALLAAGIAALSAQSVAASRFGSPSTHHVDVYRDSVGMAHLYADREEDGFYGLGYATGEDRLEQVLTWYVAVRGELAATFGVRTPPPRGDSPIPNGSRNAGPLEDAVASDIAARRFELLAIARRNLSRLPPQYLRDLRAYIDGLGFYMRSHPDRTPAWSPRLEPALPLALLHLLVLEPAHVCEAARAEDQRSAPTAAADSAPSAPDGLLAGSNAWTLAGTRTADGRVLFESDSHGPIEGYGTLFYPYRIKAGDLDFTAFAPAGTAMFFFGYSPYFAWGITEGPRYPADCYRVTVEHGSPQRFKYDGRLEKITVVPYTIAVKDGASVQGTFEYTRHNGVTSPVVAREGDIAYVVSYASADRVGLGAGEYYRMAKARSRSELEAALAELDAYPANLVIGGADGTIMFVRPGRIPVRARGVDPKHTLDGNNSTTAWRGIHTYADAIKLINPPQGYIANTNVSPDMMYPASPLKPADYPGYFGFEPGQVNSRQQRLIELLDGRSGFTVNDGHAIAMDETIPDARPWGAAIAAALHDQAEVVGSKPLDLRSFLGNLQAFDGTFSKDSRGALDYLELRTVLRDKHSDTAVALSDALATGHGLSAEQQRLLIEASAEAMQRLRELHGRTDLAWGDVHRIGRGGVDLPVGGGVSMRDASLRAFFFATDPASRREWLIGGQRVPFLVHFTAAGPDCYSQLLWGISEDPASPHYSDQARYASDKIMPLIPQSRAALQAASAVETVLTIGANATGH
jgi:acyl-homoserine-lactone acylase